MEYQQHEAIGRNDGQDWANDQRCPQASITLKSSPDDYNFIMCITDTKASHHIPHSYQNAMSTNLERWMKAMKIEMDTLKTKHTWDLVKRLSGANIMGSRWVYDIKWDGEGNRIKDKAQLVGKGYMQQL